MLNLNGQPNGHANKIPPAMSVAPSRVTLHLGHLPSKKDIKAPWPRTPSRVILPTLYSFSPLSQFRSIPTTRLGQLIAVITSFLLHMRRCRAVYPPFWVRRLRTPSSHSIRCLQKNVSSISSNVSTAWTNSWPISVTMQSSVLSSMTTRQKSHFGTRRLRNISKVGSKIFAESNKPNKDHRQRLYERALALCRSL